MNNTIKKLLREQLKKTKKNELIIERRKIINLNKLFLMLEKEIKVSDNLTKKLNNIDTPLSKKLLAFLNSDKIKDDANVDYVDYDKKNEKLITLGYTDINGNTKERLFKINKLLNYLGSDIKDIKDYEIEDLIGHLKSADTSQLKMVEGEDILKAYHCENYENDETMGSCMRYDYAQQYLKIFTDNPNEVKCLVLLNPETNKVRGRALIWHMDNDKYFMDRVYTTNKEFNTYFNNYAEENGISKSANSTVTLENGGEYDTYPYMDTFQFYDPESGTLATNGEQGWIRLQDTRGGHSDAGVYIEYGDHEGETVDEDEAFYISYRTPNGYREGWAHQDDVVFIDSELYLIDDCIKTYNHEWVYKYDDESFPVELTAGRYEGEYAKFEDTVELERNYYGEGQYITNDDDYTHLDDDIYDVPYALSDDTLETFDEKTILKSDAIALYEPHYGEGAHAHPDDATKVDIKDYGSAWVLDSDLDEFDENNLLVSNSSVTSENKKTIKKLLRESVLIDNILREITDDLDFSGFKVKDKLNSDIWVDENTVDPEISETLIQIAKDYYETLGINDIPIIDITFTGSLANYNWSKYSDIDVHIIVNLDKLDERKDLFKDLIDSKTRAWNDTHKVTVKGFDVELYIQDLNQDHHATGVYSLIKGEWVLKPEKTSPSIDKKSVRKKYKDISDKILDIEKELKNKNYKTVISRSTKLKDKIKKMRTSGLESGGEFSTENIVFKLLRRNEYMGRINDLLIQAYDKDVSIDEHILIEDYPEQFDMDYFKSLPSFRARIKYCEDNLSRISSGSSRIVYKIDDTKVLKLAKNKKGIAQNDVEIEYSKYYDIKDIVAEVFDYEENGLWVEMELATKLTIGKFKQITGLNFKDYGLALHNYAVEHGVPVMRGKLKYKIDKEFMGEMWENEFSYQILSFIANYDIPPGDLGRLNTYGVVKRNGEDTIVMIDYGLTSDVYTSYYS